jgi:hypothetical protein
VRRRVDDHFQENVIVSRQRLCTADFNERAFIEWLNSTVPDTELPAPDAETVARVAVLWFQYFGRPITI